MNVTISDLCQRMAEAGFQSVVLSYSGTAYLVNRWGTWGVNASELETFARTGELPGTESTTESAEDTKQKSLTTTPLTSHH